MLRFFPTVWPLTPGQFLPNSGRYFAWLRSENGLTQVKKLSNSIYRRICGTDWPEKCRKIPEYTSAYFSTVRHNNSRPPTQCFLWKTSVLYVALYSLMAFCATFQHNWRAKSYVLKKAILQQSMFQGQISKPFFEIVRNRSGLRNSKIIERDIRNKTSQFQIFAFACRCFYTTPTMFLNAIILELALKLVLQKY